MVLFWLNCLRYLCESFHLKLWLNPPKKSCCCKSVIDIFADKTGTLSLRTSSATQRMSTPPSRVVHSSTNQLLCYQSKETNLQESNRGIKYEIEIWGPIIIVQSWLMLFQIFLIVLSDIYTSMMAMKLCPTLERFSQRLTQDIHLLFLFLLKYP